MRSFVEKNDRNIEILILLNSAFNVRLNGQNEYLQYYFMFQVFLSSNSPGGGGGTSYRSSPAQAIQSASRFVSTYQASPSLHGDDPWLRFM